jgi:hypothetical protein
LIGVRLTIASALLHTRDGVAQPIGASVRLRASQPL